MAKVVKSKYNSTGERCINACLNYGELRYINDDDTPIKVELPYDKYDEAINDFGDRVKEGMIGSTLESNKIFCRGNFTYNQAKNLATEGKIKGLNFYEIDGSIECDHILGISSCIEFALSVWNNELREVAVMKSLIRAIKTYGEEFIEVFNYDESINIEDYIKFAKKAFSAESILDLELYKFKNYEIQEDYKENKKTLKQKVHANTDINLGIFGGFMGFLLIQLSTKYGQLIENDVIFIVLNIFTIFIFAIVFMQSTKYLTDKHIKDDNTNISDMFNEELEKAIYENILTQKEVYIILKNITKGEVTKLLTNMKGSVNKKISSNTIVTKETKFMLDGRRIVILPTEDEMKAGLAKIVELYNEKLEKDYNVSNI